MTTLQIKIFAFLCMISAHIQLFFAPDNLTLFVFGAQAFPLFAWLIANGAHHTKDMYRYSIRILIFACISQLPFLLANKTLDPQYNQLNILFTFFFGLIAIVAMNRLGTILHKTLAVVCIGILAEILHADYGLYGIAAVVTFYVLFDSIKYTAAAFILLSIARSLFWLKIFFAYSALSAQNISNILPLGIFSLLIIRLYSGKEGRKLKYIFYAFYPLHYMLIYALARYL